MRLLLYLTLKLYWEGGYLRKGCVDGVEVHYDVDQSPDDCGEQEDCRVSEHFVEAMISEFE